MTRAWIEIDLKNITRNIGVIRKKVYPAGVLACVKANAYGLGLEVVAGCLDKDADAFGVTTVSEGVALRNSGIKKTVLVFIPPAGDEEISDGLKKNLALTVFQPEEARRISRIASETGQKATVHLKVDTGMGRLGAKPQDLPSLFCCCRKLPRLEVRGIFTHFPVAETRNRFTRQQVKTFMGAASQVKENVSDLVLHAANSAAVINYPESYLDLVRPGIALYGINPSASQPEDLNLDLTPAVTLKSRIVFIKDIEPGCTVSYGRRFCAKKKTRVATVSIGYADGYPRQLSNQANVLVGGRRCPVIGTICMDMVMVDVSGVGNIRAGDPVILFGCQGTNRIGVEEVAGWAKTVPHEILSRLGPRLPRLYLNEPGYERGEK